jgi:rsbT co-antagonist protein RsbR
MQEYIATMQKTMLGLSTPSIEVSEGTLVMPLIGTLDEARARHLTETLLQDIARTRARTVIIDVAGITTIDTKTASHLLRTNQAMKLTGTHVIITGIRPQVSETMAQLGVALEGIPTLRDIPQALDYAQGSRARPALRP